MYEQFYGLREKPFSLLPDPTFLYLGQQHSTAYSMLEYGVLNQAGFTVVTGEVGCGKTTLIRHLLDQLDSTVTIGLLSNTNRNFSNLLRWVLMAYGLGYDSKTDTQLYETFVDFLVSEYAHDRRVVLIVDEAQNLDATTLEELRTLSNINADKHLVLQLILVGQPELKATLDRQDMKQLAQRVVAHYHLRALAEEETIAYVRHRLEHAGGSPELFTLAACRQVHDHCGGVPRLINLLCDTALVYGYAEDAEQIGEDLVRSVIEEQAAGMHLGRRNEQPTSPHQTVSPSTPEGTDMPQDKATGKRDSGPGFDRSEARQLFSHLLK